MEHEEWRPIEGFPGYEVGSLGHIRSYWKAGFASGGIPHMSEAPHLLSIHLSPYTHVAANEAGRIRSTRRYPRVSLRRDRVSHDRSVHILVCEAFHGARRSGLLVRHLDDDPNNCAAVNLAWGTPKQNKQDHTANTNKRYDTIIKELAEIRLLLGHLSDRNRAC